MLQLEIMHHDWFNPDNQFRSVSFGFCLLYEISSENEPILGLGGSHDFLQDLGQTLGPECFGRKEQITSFRVIPTMTLYYYTFVTNSDILCAKIWRGREGEDNSDEI